MGVLGISQTMETELFASVEAGDFDKFKELIKKETKETVDQVDFYGYTALHAAAENARLEMIPPLLEAGADINRATYDATFTSLHHALAKGHMECTRHRRRRRELQSNIKRSWCQQAGVLANI